MFATEKKGARRSNLQLYRPEQEVGKQDVKADSPHSIQNQKLLLHPFTGFYVRPGSEIYDKLKAREDILNRQRAIFDKMLAPDDSGETSIVKRLVVPEASAEPMSCASAEPMSSPSAAIPSSHVPPASAANRSDDYLKMPAKQDHTADQQITFLDEIVIKPPKPKSTFSAPVSPSYEFPTNHGPNGGKQLFLFDDGIVPQSLARPGVRRVHAPILPSYAPCPKLDHQFCVRSDCLNTYYSYFLDASNYIPPPRPLVKNV